MTVLLPHITRQIVERRYIDAVETYRSYLEISYISTALFALSVLTAAPEAMNLLYSEKYLSGLPVFCIYIISDIFHFASITLILTASGKTKLLMRIGLTGLVVNFVLNIIFYHFFGVVGPAIATLLVSLGLGAFILHYSANELHASIHDLFDCKFLMKFTVECIGGVLIFTTVRYWLRTMEMYYLGVFIITCGGYILCVGLPNLKRFMIDIKQISSLKL